MGKAELGNNKTVCTSAKKVVRGNHCFSIENMSALLGFMLDLAEFTAETPTLSPPMLATAAGGGTAAAEPKSDDRRLERKTRWFCFGLERDGCYY